MNQKTISVLVIGVALLIGASVYFSDMSMPFGRGDAGMEEMQEHTAGDEHVEDEHEVPEHNDALKSYEISPGEVVNKVRSNENVVLLDVRTLEEYEDVHLKDALLLPVQELSQETLTSIGLGEDMKEKEIILYCRSGARSQTAYNIMESLGYTNIKSVAGGMIHWEEDNYPLTESGPYTGPMMMSSSGETATEVDGPKVSLNRTLHDFGVIPQYGGTVETTFVVANDGTEDLEIGQITTSCSCTSATIADSVIEPGDESILTVVFDPNLHEEPLDVFKRTVFLPTNDLNTPEAEVAVQVDIQEGE